MPRRREDRLAGEVVPRRSAVQARIRDMLVLERLCSRFPRVVERLRVRTGQRPTLRVEDETDVQDLLHALLVLEYDDVRPEVWTPPYAPGRPRTDFFLALEQIVLVARLCGPDETAGLLREQLASDCARYRPRPGCRTLVCFLYDPDGRLPNPRSLEADLSQDADGLTVRVLIARPQP